MNLQQIYEDTSLDSNLSIEWSDDEYFLTKKKTRRRTLARIFQACMSKLPADAEKASSIVRQIWNGVIDEKRAWDLPAILSEDGFLHMYAKGMTLRVKTFRKIWEKIREAPGFSPLPPIFFGETEDATCYHNIKATPPGFMPKLFSSSRLKKDKELLNKVRSDLKRVAQIEDSERRKYLTLAILSHGASYRELDGEVVEIPSMVNNKLIPYSFRHHLVWEGIKTISASPLEHEHHEPGIYICQGTEIWPSQPSTLGSIYANLGKEGPATEPYARCWRQIHNHLRALTLEEDLLPIVAGHSLGGALATQILLYSHPMIAEAFAFNPTGVEDRGYQVYHRLSPETRAKLTVFANLDDIPFWRIGSNVIGRVMVFLPEVRKPYRPIRRYDWLLLFPGLCKMISNIINALPSHQNIFPLYRRYVALLLSQEEIDRENGERTKRFDYIGNILKYRRLNYLLLTFGRRIFGWKQKEAYIRSQIELIELHEQDLQDTLAYEGGAEIQQELRELERQKEELIRQLD